MARDEHALAPARGSGRERFAMVWVLPVPGGPCTSTTLLCSTSCAIASCSGFAGLARSTSGSSPAVAASLASSESVGVRPEASVGEDVGTDDLHQVRGHVAVFGDVLPDAADRTANAARTWLNKNDGTRLEREGGFFTRVLGEFFFCGYEAAVWVKACGELFRAPRKATRRPQGSRPHPHPRAIPQSARRP